MTDTSAKLAQELHARLDALLTSKNEKAKSAIIMLLRTATNGENPVKRESKKPAGHIL